MALAGVTRQALREYFEIDRLSIAFAALKALISENSVDPSTLGEFMARYSYAPAESHPWSDRRTG